MADKQVVGLTLEDIAYLRELLANRADAQAALGRAETQETLALAQDAVRNAEAFWGAYGAPLLVQAIDIAERTLLAAAGEPDTRRAHAIVLTADSAKPGDLARELRALAGRLETTK
ncbi:hypothetical protein sos41_32970 [Alphaproteobacteria bacterium SO-S41]|nr:hypothetical protein sos41_32970 [Alphaproteobacteria bacterium SO-S41]